MNLATLLHPGVQQLLVGYDLKQHMLSIENTKIMFENAQLLMKEDQWYSLTIYDHRKMFTITKNNDGTCLLTEYILNTETHRWNKSNQTSLRLLEDYLRLCVIKRI